MANFIILFHSIAQKTQVQHFHRMLSDVQINKHLCIWILSFCAAAHVHVCTEGNEIFNLVHWNSASNGCIKYMVWTFELEFCSLLSSFELNLKLILLFHSLALSEIFQFFFKFFNLKFLPSGIFVSNSQSIQHFYSSLICSFFVFELLVDNRNKLRKYNDFQTNSNEDYNTHCELFHGKNQRKNAISKQLNT